MNRRSFLKFAGLAPVVPVLAVDILSPTSAIFIPMSTDEAVNNMGSAMMVGEAMESGKKGDIIKVRFGHYEVKV